MSYPHGETRELLSEFVAKSIDILSKKELQLPRIETLPINALPASVLSYQLYETDNRTTTLMGLNADQDPILYRENAQILRDEN